MIWGLYLGGRLSWGSVNNGTSVIEGWLMGGLYSGCVIGNLYLRVTGGSLCQEMLEGTSLSLSGIQGL